MALIYKTSYSVIVWLGEGDSAEADAAVFALIAVLGKDRSPNMGRRVAHHSFRTIRRNEPHCRHTLYLQALLGLPMGGNPRHKQRGTWSMYDAIEQLHAFCSRRYFTRRWVVQEYHAAEKNAATVRWGPYQCTMSDVRELLINLFGVGGSFFATGQLGPACPRAVQQKHEDLEVLEADCHNMLVAAHSTYYVGKEEDLLTKLGRCSKLDCSEARDRLYSLIGMDTKFCIVPDYSFNTAQAYSQLGKAMWEAGEGVCASHNLQRHRLESKALGLPSWAPDLRFGFDRSQYINADLAGRVDQHGILTYSPYHVGWVREIIDDSRFMMVDSVSVEQMECFLKHDPDHFENVAEDDLVCGLWRTGEGAALGEGTGHFEYAHILRTTGTFGTYRLLRAISVRSQDFHIKDRPFTDIPRRRITLRVS